MDRRERYDPEDIESLMMERSFDELLEEERAYVLRHISGETEYEAMRNLLLHMQDDALHPTPIEADPRIRSAVLRSFRLEQQPRWRIWLNSLASALWPAEASAMWRPALALAGLALLIVTTVLVVRQSNIPDKELAELHPIPANKVHEQPGSIATRENDMGADNTASTETLNAQLQPGTTASVEASEEVEKSTKVDRVEMDLDATAEPRSTGVEPAMFHAAVAEDRLAETKVQTDMEVLDSIGKKETRSDTYSHLVSQDELTRNMSVANATGKVQAGKTTSGTMRKNNVSKSNSLESNEALMDLIAAGW